MSIEDYQIGRKGRYYKAAYMKLYYFLCTTYSQVSADKAEEIHNFIVKLLNSKN